MRIKASEPFTTSMTSNTKTGGSAALETEPSQSSVIAATTPTNIKDSVVVTAAMPKELEANVKKETAEVSANDKSQHIEQLFSSSPLVLELSSEERLLSAANVTTSSRKDEETFFNCTNLAEASTNVEQEAKETVNGEHTSSVAENNVANDECIVSRRALPNSVTSVMTVNSPSSPSLFSATTSPPSPPILNTNAYTAAALHGKRLPPSRQRSSYGGNALHAINNSINKNKSNKSINSKLSGKNDNDKSNTCCNNDSNSNNNAMNAFNKCERVNGERLVNCKVASKNTHNKSNCDSREERNTTKQTRTFPVSEQEVYREGQSASLPHTSDINNSNENNGTCEVIRSSMETEQTGGNSNVAGLQCDATHCSAHLKQVNLYINLPSSFVRSSQLCDSEVESVITSTSSSTSSCIIETTDNNNDNINDSIISRNDSFSSSATSCSCSTSSNSNSNNSKHECHSDNCYQFLSSEYSDRFYNYHNWISRRFKKHKKSSSAFESDANCIACHGNINGDVHNHEAKPWRPWNKATQWSDKNKSKLDYVLPRRQFSFYSHATQTFCNAEAMSYSHCHSHSAPAYYKRCNSYTNVKEKKECDNLRKKTNINFSKTDDKLTSSTQTTKKKCTHSPSLTLLPSSLSFHSLYEEQQKENQLEQVHGSNKYENIRGKCSNREKDKCTPLSPFSLPHHVHYHNHPDEQNTLRSNSNIYASNKVKSVNVICEQQNSFQQTKELEAHQMQENEKSTKSSKIINRESNAGDYAKTVSDRTHTRKITSKHQFHIQVPTESYCSPPPLSSSASSAAALLSFTNSISTTTKLTTSANTTSTSSNVLPSSLSFAQCLPEKRKTSMKCNARAQYTNFMHSEFSAVEVLPGLFLGTRVDANDLQLLRQHDISLVINVSEDCPVPPAEHTNPLHIRVIQFALKDHSDEVISPFFVPITNIIHQQLHRRQAYQHLMKKEANNATPDVHSVINTPTESSPHSSKDTVSPVKVKEQTEEISCTNVKNKHSEDNADSCPVSKRANSFSNSLQKHNSESDNSKTGNCTEMESESTNVIHKKEQIREKFIGDFTTTTQQTNKDKATEITGVSNNNNDDDDNKKSDLVELFHCYLPSEAMEALPCVPTHWPCVDARDCGGVLIHCRMGVSRSASFVLAYLILFGTTLAPLTDPSSLFATLPFTEKQLAERVGGRTTWGDAFQSWVDRFIKSNTKQQDKTLNSMPHQKCETSEQAKEWGANITHKNHHEEEEEEEEEFREVLQELMQKDPHPDWKTTEPMCTTPRARAAYNCIACWRLRQQRQRWALAKHVLMGHSHALHSTRSSRSSVTSTSKSMEEEKEHTEFDIGSPIQHSSFALSARTPLSCKSPSETSTCPFDTQGRSITGSITSNNNSKSNSKIDNNAELNQPEVYDINNSNLRKCTRQHSEPIKVTSILPYYNKEQIQGTPMHDLLSTTTHKKEACHSCTRSNNNSRETKHESMNASSVPVKRETSYSRRRKLKHASLIHRRESYYGHDVIGENVLRHLPPPHKLCLHTSFTSHSMSSCSPSVATPLTTQSPTRETFYSANTNANTTTLTEAASPVSSCMRSAQLTPCACPLASSPVFSFASGSIASPLTEPMKGSFEENIFRSSMRPPYLEIVAGMSYREAFEFLKSKKHDISPNIGFVLALRELAAGNDFSVSSSN